MEIKELLSEERAVSPVIGVILMVAITVILAAVIGTFVLGLGQNVQSTPSASFAFDYNGSTNVTVTHEGGDQLNSENSASITINSSGGASTVWADSSSNFPITAGDSKTLDGLTAGETVRVIWKSPKGGNSATLGQSQVPS